MRTFSLAALSASALLALMQSASAAPPVYSWTGFYIGANAGYSWGKTGSTYDAVGNGTTTFFED